MKRKRKNYTPEEKVAIVKRHLVDKVAVSDLCDEYHLNRRFSIAGKKNSSGWRDTLRQKSKETDKIKAVEQKLQRKHEVLSELMEEHVKLQKLLRRFKRRLWVS